MAEARHAAFISYAHRYKDWVRVLHANLERCLGPGRTVFLDQVDLGSGRSWVGQLQAGLDQADRLVLVVTPEALASPRVADEWESFVALRRDWRQGKLHLAVLVDTPIPPFLEPIQQVDFRRPGEESYRRALRELVGGLLGQEDRRKLPELPAGIELPALSASGLSQKLRTRLVDWLTPILQERKANRRAVESGLRLGHDALEGYPSWACAASAALVKATGDDDPVQATLRILAILEEELGQDEPERVGALRPLRDEVESLRQSGPEQGLLRNYLDSIARDHSTLVRYFEQPPGLELLERVYVQLELKPEAHALPAARHAAADLRVGALDLEDLLGLDPAEHPWITRRWVVRGEPGAGKTTLLRHLAATIAKQPEPRWVPIFESLPRLMREREWFLDRITRRLERAGQPVTGLPAVLDRAGQEGRLLLLLDGLDEVPREDREDAEKLLRDLSSRWPSAPLVVTTRPIGYRRLGSEFVDLDLLPLGAERRREFLARWFGRSTGEPDFERAVRELTLLEEDSGLRELAGNPLYLTLMALLLEQGASPDRNRTRLYDQVFELLLEGKHRPAGEPIDCKQGVRKILRYLGHAMTRVNRDAESVGNLEARLYEPAADRLREPLERVPRWRKSMRPFLEDLAEHTGILGPHDGSEADWRFWHRTFREALAAEELEQGILSRGPEAILTHAQEIVGDESRWAEPYALLAGRVKDPDHLVRSLIKANRALGLRALATAQGLRDQTLLEVLDLSGRIEERIWVYERLPELVGDADRALALLDRLRRRTRDGNDLFFIDLAIQSIGVGWPDHRLRAANLQSRLYDHIPAPPEDLFSWIETPCDGRVPLWREIPAGESWIGNSEGRKRYHYQPYFGSAIITRPFRMGAVPVTNAQFAAFDPEHGKSEDPETQESPLSRPLPLHPVVDVSWFAAMSFCRWLSSVFGWARGARLPTEVEWEHACRAGARSRFWGGDDEKDLARMAWWIGNSGIKIHQVGEKPPNPWGLYDMHGNVREWAENLGREYDEVEYGIEVPVDPDKVCLSGATLRETHLGEQVVRGGSYLSNVRACSADHRACVEPGVKDFRNGFRIFLPGPLSSPVARS